MDIKTGDILLEKGTALVSNIIKFATNSKYSHVAMVYDAEEELIIQSHWSSGVYITHINTLSDFDIRRIKTLYENHTEKEIKDACRKYLGREYGKLEIFEMWFKSILLGQDYFNNPQNVFCTELVDLICKDLDYDLIKDKYIGDLTPEDCSESHLY
jgi:hypothetical protein